MKKPYLSKRKIQDTLRCMGALYGEKDNAIPLILGRPVSSSPKPAKTPKRKTRTKVYPRLSSEAAEQIALVTWARLKGLLLFSIPNGAKRTPWSGEREKALGLLGGVCDLFLAEPRGAYNGYFIEMKAGGKKPRPNQIEFMDKVRAKGYHSNWFDSFEKAKLSIEEYLCNK